MMQPLCQSMLDWTDQHFQNVLVVHWFEVKTRRFLLCFALFWIALKQLCSNKSSQLLLSSKAGKGRTGVAISCYLIYSGLWQEAEEAMMIFAATRTHNNKGVTIPSQKVCVSSLTRWSKLLSLESLSLSPLKISPTNTKKKISAIYKILCSVPTLWLETSIRDPKAIDSCDQADACSRRKLQ